MAKRRKPWWGAGPYEDFRQKVVQRFRRFDLDAENHIIGRNAALAQVLGYVSLLCNAGKIPPSARLVPNQEGARWQSTGG